MTSLRELELLDRSQCLALLDKASVGRLVFTEHALPAVQPVDFRQWRGDVVIRIADPTVLAAASGNRIVAFETDELDADLQGGWSVTVVGHAQAITEVPDLIELSGIFSRPCSGSRRDYFVRIRTEKVTGRRLCPEVDDRIVTD
jgi:nitroimidazol reductase NimA-like FMN-containing flavoprotein (pyridoxamine 5'-phosphate oxidase superfamily)